MSRQQYFDRDDADNIRRGLSPQRDSSRQLEGGYSVATHRDRSPSPAPRRRRRSQSPKRERRREKERGREHSPSDSDSSENEGHSRRRSRSRSRDRETKSERKARKRAKKEARRAKKAAKRAKMGVIDTYGAHGILTEADIYTKDAEYRTWLVEEKMINPETLTQSKTREYFKTFMEDFNTSSLPHDKYYNLAEYDKRMSALRMGEDHFDEKAYDPRKDEEDIRNARRRAAPKNEPSILSREQLLDLQRIERERVEAHKMKRLGMDTKRSMGVRYETTALVED